MIGELRQRLKGGPCRVYSPDKRISVRDFPSYTYPDVSVICGPEQVDPRDPARRSGTNPKVIVEVMSPTSEGRDRGPKFTRYLSSESLEEYVLVSHDVPRVETYLRQPAGTWLFPYAVGVEATVRLRSLDVELPLAEVYLNVEFPPQPPEPEPVADAPPVP